MAAIRALGEIPNKYLFYYLRSIEEWLSKEGTGSTFTAIKKKDLEQLAIPLAPLAEQRRIVTKLERLLKKVDACQTRLEKIPTTLKRFRQAVLAAACSGRLTADWRGSDDVDGFPVAWSKVEFEDLMLETPKNGLYKPQTDYGRGTPILRIDNFYDGYIESLENLKRVNISKTEVEQYGLAVGDIVVNRVNSMKFLGKSALVRNLLEPTIFESNMMRIWIDKTRAQPQYVITYLRSLRGLEELRKNAKHAVNQSSINQGDVKVALFNLPPLPEQLEIVRRVEELFVLSDQIEARCMKAKAHTDKLTRSILAKAFRGELVLQDPNDEPASKLLERIKASQMANHREQKKEAAKPRSTGRKGKQDDKNN